jgi:hypothetical protein
MTDIRFDLRDFERQAKRLGAAVDQVPYALSKTMAAGSRERQKPSAR